MKLIYKSPSDLICWLLSLPGFTFSCDYKLERKGDRQFFLLSPFIMNNNFSES